MFGMMVKSKWTKVAIAIGVSVIALVLSIMFNLTKPYIIPMNIISLILLWGIVFLCRYLVHNYCEKEHRKTVMYIWGIVSLIGFAIYFFFVMNRTMTYTDDHTVYYNSYFELRSLFEATPLKGFTSIVTSCWKSDYSYFITILLSLPFSFTSLSHEAFILCYYCIFIVPVFLSANIFCLSLAKKAKVKRIKTVLWLANVCMLLFPLLHFASLLGMPDIYGLLFCFCIFLLLNDQRFEKFDIKFVTILTALVILLIISRRWYVFFLLGFLPAIYVFTFLDSLLNKKDKVKTIIINELKSIAFLGGCALIVLGPFVYLTLFVRNYSEEYSGWYLGGFPFELFNQLGYLGIVLAVVLVVGLIYGIKERQLRVLTLSCIVGMILTILSFTLIQNMGKHQSLCLFPYYTVFLYNFIIMSNRMKNKSVRIASNVVIITIFVLNALSSVFTWYDDLNGVFLLTKYAIASRFQWSF